MCCFLSFGFNVVWDPFWPTVSWRRVTDISPVSRNLYGRKVHCSLSSALSWARLWLIRTTLLFICLTRVCVQCVPGEWDFSKDLVLLLYPTNEIQPLESGGQWGASIGVLCFPVSHPQTPAPARSEVEMITLELWDRAPIPTWKRLWCMVDNEHRRLPTATHHYHADHGSKWNGSSR